MGGFGSGAQSRWASKTDEFHKLDLATFKREWFENWRRGSMRWSRGGVQTSSISYRLTPVSMRLIYSVPSQGERVSIDERFNLVFTEQPFGGRRRWILCRSCNRRCRVLYGGAYFRCRQCYQATYPSQYETIRVRGLSRAERIRDQLGGEPGFLNPFPDKPKGMHWRSYRRIERQDWAAADALDRAFHLRFNRLEL
ncbi:hypothetical protein [Hyphomonas sp.]|jgi:hypothetical protein|uniref:hypothetical protein n=1 Tax=Hyphomonas sp. TaxID=87 RepID=UPI0026222524|nr:hypothetical protein [Hyphomonas sp.]MDF1806853.1 hypothetical protein [Hyphomonas sp.]